MSENLTIGAVLNQACAPLIYLLYCYQEYKKRDTSVE